MSAKQKLELTWVGKGKHQKIEPRILMCDKSKDYGDVNSENMLIHGDNLLALKAIEQEFAGKIKCIYIDPPYNTGSAFEHYDDNLEHSIWLTLIASRLRILHTLLSKEGSIWISLDDTEQAYMKVLMDEIFGRNNFINNVIWQKKFSPQNDAKWLSDNHDFIIVYAKDKNSWRPNLLPRTDEMDERYKNPDNDPRGVWSSSDLSVKRVTLKDIYEVKTPSGRIILPPKGRSWAYSKDSFERLLKDNRVWFGEKGDNVPRVKRFLTEVKQGTVSMTIWEHKEVGHNQDAKKEVVVFNSKDVFETPKPERLIERILTLGSNEGDLVLDSFLGSGTTSAVAHKMGRKWIGIELGDHCYTHCIPRMQKVIDGTDQGGISKAVNWKGGGGFKFYELASTLIHEDCYGNKIISKEYNAEMLSEAMCKLMGYKYSPDQAIFWKQGYGTENNYIFVTNIVINEEYLKEISIKLGNESLLVCCSAFVGNPKAIKNVTVKKIPQAVLEKCEWNNAGYPLPVIEDFKSEDFEFEGYYE